MNIGAVTAAFEARVDLMVRGPDGTEVEVSAIVDTGFSEYLTLPLRLIECLNLPLWETSQVRLADGSLRTVDAYQGRVRWSDSWRKVLIQASEGDSLLGMAVLRDHQVVIDVIVGGAVAVENLG
jgi:clan AA aspartic protease